MNVLVTGSSGGIGSAIASRFASGGSAVVGLDIREPRSGSEWEHRSVDLEDSQALASVLGDLSDDVGLVVHTAAHQPLFAVGTGSLSAWRSAFAVNVLALEQTVSALAPGLRSKRGTVIAMSSVHASTTSANMAAYSSTKAALEGWVRAASIDLAPEVAAFSISLGAVDTAKLDEGLARWSDPVAAKAALTARIPAGRIITAEEVAGCVFALRLPEFRHLTGSTLRLDGGVSARLASE